MAAPVIAIPESVRAAQLASIEKLHKRLQDSKPEESCSIDLVPEAFSCAICHDLFVKPRQCFPCRHSFCEPCLRQVANSEMHRDAYHCTCPLCRESIHYSRLDKRLEAEILRSPLANLYAERSQSDSRNSEMQAKPLPGLALLSFLPTISPSYRRINRMLSFITLALLWLCAKSTRSLLLDWLLLRTPEAEASMVLLFPLSSFAYLLLLISTLARQSPREIRFAVLGADYCSARRVLPDTCPVPHFPNELQFRAQLDDFVLPPEAYVGVALCVFLVCSFCGPPLRRSGGFRRLGNAVSFVSVCGMCTCALFSLLRFVLILRY